MSTGDLLSEPSRAPAPPEEADGGASRPSNAAHELSEQRSRIVRVLLGSIVALGMLAYVPSVWLSLQVGAPGIAVADTVVYAALVFALVKRGLRYPVRAGVLLGASYLLGALLIFAFGPVSAGPLWLGAVPVLAATLFERRAILWSLVAAAATLVAAVALLSAGVLDWGLLPAQIPLTAVIGGNLLLLSGGLAFAVGTLIRGLRESAERAERLGAELERERALLQEANARLQREMAERADAEARLRQAEKLTALGTLAGGVAHNLNNLLTPLLMGVELLRTEHGEGAEIAELLDQMEGAAGGARDVVRQVLTFARALPEGRGATDAPAAFREAARLLAASLPPTIELVTEIDPEAGAIALSAADAHQILLNLGSNATNAMPEGGRIRVSLSAEGGGADSAGRVCLTVRDEGTGMDAVTRERAVEPFFTTRPPGRGTGLGLATVHGMVQAAGGTMEIESAPGAGTTVRVHLPRLDETDYSEAVTRATIRSRGERRVLLVDGDGSERAVAHSYLERTGWKVREAATADEALSTLDSSPTPFDLVIASQELGDVRGSELVREARRRHPELHVLLTSGSPDGERRELAVGVGAPVITRPIRVAELHEALHAERFD